MANYVFPTSKALVHNDTHNGDVAIVIRPTVDAEGNFIHEFDQEEVILQMDNYQAYKVAMDILSKIDVADTRGGS